MKTVMKKIFSLMLVAVLLVSAVPFAASAAETYDLSIDVNGVNKLVTKGTSTSYDECLAASGIDTAANVITNAVCEYTDAEGKVQKVDGFVAGGSAFALQGPTRVFFFTEPKATEPTTAPTTEPTTAPTTEPTTAPTTEPTTEPTTAPTTQPTTAPTTEPTTAPTTQPSNPVVRFIVDGKVFWSVEVLPGRTCVDPGIKQNPTWEELKKVGDTDNRVFVAWSRSVDGSTGYFPTLNAAVQPVYEDVTYYAIFQRVDVAPPTSSNGNGITNKDNTNKVYLHVYLNGNASTIALTKDITESYLLDDNKTSNGEIWTYLTNNYYTAKDVNKGVHIDGLYVNTGDDGTFPQNYYTDTKQDTLNDIESLRSQGYVHINVMLKGAVAKGTYTADSSNPKTGDMIFAPVAILGLSASALAVLFFLNKKRAY